MAIIGKLFVMPPDMKIKIVNYILSMQDLGFGQIVNQVRHVAFKAVEAAGVNHSFSWESRMAGWYWWDKLRV
jgi:hypothetical protein